LLICLGCGSRGYDRRLNETIVLMRYRKNLDDNLTPPATKGKLDQNSIYLRPPKNLQKMSEFSLTVLEPGKFDVAETFVEKDVQNLHVLARVQKIKDPKKKGAATPETPRGEFKTEVYGLLSGVFSVDVDTLKDKDETKGKNKYKHLAFEANGKMVHCYLYGSKTNLPEVALIFEYPKSETGLTSKIDFCLQSFATGTKARLLFTGSEEDASGEPTAPAGGAAAF
jgi:hypothetical protein